MIAYVNRKLLTMTPTVTPVACHEYSPFIAPILRPLRLRSRWMVLETRRPTIWTLFGGAHKVWCPAEHLRHRRCQFLIALAALLAFVWPLMAEATRSNSALGSAIEKEFRAEPLAKTGVADDRPNPEENRSVLPHHMPACQHAHCNHPVACAAAPQTIFVRLVANGHVFGFGRGQLTADARLPSLERPPRRGG